MLRELFLMGDGAGATATVADGLVLASLTGARLISLAMTTAATRNAKQVLTRRYMFHLVQSRAACMRRANNGLMRTMTGGVLGPLGRGTMNRETKTLTMCRAAWPAGWPAPPRDRPAKDGADSGLSSRLSPPHSCRAKSPA